MTIRSAHWSAALAEHGLDPGRVNRLVAQLGACEVSALAFCRLLERWARGDADPCTPGKRQAAFRRAAERVETALVGLEEPLGRYLLELEADQAESASWYGEPSNAEFVEWEPVLKRAGVSASPARVTRAYLERAVFVRALEGLAAAAQWDAVPDRSALWAGLFDLRENLLNGAAQDLRALAA
jgi:hypothetical protein